MRNAVAIALLVACSSHARPRPPGPKLVVLVVVDQLPEWSLEAKLPALHGGFARALAEGEWHVGEHPSAATVTATGHALIGTGAPPAQSGIVANAWWDPALRREIHATWDIDESVTSKWLRVPGLGDAIVAAGGKAVAVSLKDRAAVLPLGHAGRSIWYDPKAARWTTIGKPPVWLDRYNEAHPVETTVWQPLAQVPALARVADDQPGEHGEKDFGPTFPHDPKRTKKPAEAVFAMPIGDDIVLDTALAAIDGEQLGYRATPDLLVISLSAYDYVGHGWGHESWEAWDTTLRLDAKLAEVFATLDRTLGTNGWAAVLTSDHGGSPMPAGRITYQTIRATAQAAAEAVLGKGTWIDYVQYPTIVFAGGLRARPDAIAHVLEALRALPGLGRVDRVADVSGHCDTRAGDERALCETFDPERSGDVFFLPARGWVFEEADEQIATSHGSMYDYDRDVPLILMPFGRTPHAPEAKPGAMLEMTSVAPLVRTWLGIR